MDDTALDPLTRHIFESHWREESQHARLDHVETLRAFRGLTLAEQERAIDDFIDLITGMDGLLHTQARLDVENLQRCIWRRLDEVEQAEILAARAGGQARHLHRGRRSPTRTSRSCCGW